MSETDERVIVDFDQAVAMLPDGNYIHTFRQAGPALIGANWSREKMLNWLKAHMANCSSQQNRRKRAQYEH